MPEPNELLSALTGDWGAKPEKRPAAAAPEKHAGDGQASIRAFQLIRAYRMIGHLEARLDPLELEKRKPFPQLQPSFYGFQNEDLERSVFIDGIMGLETVTPRELVGILRRTYCGAIGYEYMHVTDPEQRILHSTRETPIRLRGAECQLDVLVPSASLRMARAAQPVRGHGLIDATALVRADLEPDDVLEIARALVGGAPRSPASSQARGLVREALGELRPAAELAAAIPLSPEGEQLSYNAGILAFAVAGLKVAEGDRQGHRLDGEGAGNSRIGERLGDQRVDGEVCEVAVGNVHA